jgi:Lon protease-like protein
MPEPVHRPMFPLGTVLFPGAILPLHVFEPRYRAMMYDCLSAERRFGVVLITRGSEVGGGDQRVTSGTEARIEHATELPDGRWTVIALGTRRFLVESWLPDDPYPQALVRLVPDDRPPKADALAAAARTVRTAIALLSELGRARPIDAPLAADTDEEAVALAWRLCDIAPLGPLDRQILLHTDDPDVRLATLVDLTDQVVADLHRLLAEGGRSAE